MAMSRMVCTMSARPRTGMRRGAASLALVGAQKRQLFDEARRRLEFLAGMQVLFGVQSDSMNTVDETNFANAIWILSGMIDEVGFIARLGSVHDLI